MTPTPPPDVRQSQDYNCGDAAVDTVLRHFGVRTCVGFLGLANQIQGVGPDSVRALLRKAGLQSCAGTMTVKDLRHHTSLGRLVLCPISHGGGHWVAVWQVRGRTVYYQCPDRGPQEVGAVPWDNGWRDKNDEGVIYDHYGIATWL